MAFGPAAGTLGVFLGTLSYCMAALPTARSFPRPFAPVVTVLSTVVLALVCVGLQLFFIHQISQAISVNHSVDRIAGETETMIDEMMPRPRLGKGRSLGAPRVIERHFWASSQSSAKLIVFLSQQGTSKL